MTLNNQAPMSHGKWLDRYKWIGKVGFSQVVAQIKMVVFPE